MTTSDTGTPVPNATHTTMTPEAAAASRKRMQKLRPLTPHRPDPDMPLPTRAWEAFTAFWRNYFNVEARTDRFGFWVPTLIMTFLLWLLQALVRALFAGVEANQIQPWVAQSVHLVERTLAYASIVPQLTCMVRRYRDIGISPYLAIFFTLPYLNLVALAAARMPSGWRATSRWRVMPYTPVDDPDDPPEYVEVPPETDKSPAPPKA